MAAFSSGGHLRARGPGWAAAHARARSEVLPVHRRTAESAPEEPCEYAGPFGSAPDEDLTVPRSGPATAADPPRIVRLRYDTELEITATTAVRPDLSVLFETRPLEAELAASVVLEARARFEAREREALARRQRAADLRLLGEVALGAAAVLSIVVPTLYFLFTW